jgi:quinol monooxygenase YgiN
MTQPLLTRQGTDEVWLMPVFIAKAGYEADLQDALLALQTVSREDPGCLQYTVFNDGHRPEKFVLFEGWSSADALKAHNEESHVKEFVKTVDSLLAAPFSVTPLAPVA